MKVEGISQEYNSTEGMQSGRNNDTKNDLVEQKSNVTNQVSDDAEKYSINSLQDSLKKINNSMDMFNIQIQFELDKDKDNNNQVVVYMINKQTGQVVRTIPPSHVVTASERIHLFLGILVDELV